ncbi:glycosyltransferase family 2 protein [Roseibium porphyridii]|uniref:Glycosyltransferase family 2 protein n=1 Tax=Roseibium porphyridii TaxID=2866279 RepID=A0ABY8F753_9HYPH|nr:glycosyltransferase family 2 protein [Roseibium sp. KMA01]WFE89927.1 glycosyltransferase family 2 protein [Roseibium sp. KMA01]
MPRPDITEKTRVSTSLSHQLLDAFGTPVADKLVLPRDGVVAVILAYNEALRFPHFLDHYRTLGVRHFIVIDNGSDDGTGAFLNGQTDVSVVETHKPYRDYKSVWRQLLCDRYLQDRWVLFPDVDELLVYPGWPDLSINDLTLYLDSGGYQALFTPMVDMYPDGPLNNLTYKPGERFLDCCPWFDGDGYRYNPLKGSHGKRYKTPARHVFGGTRERLFHQHAKRPTTALDRWLLGSVFSLRAKASVTAFGRKLDHLLFKLVKNALPSPAAVQSKIPLLKWQAGICFSGGVHGIDREVPVAPDWGVLLHFKYLDDFKSKVAEAITRKQHTDNAGHYRDYNSQIESLMEKGLRSFCSLRFDSVETLIDCGLMRETPALRNWVSRLN